MAERRAVRDSDLPEPPRSPATRVRLAWLRRRCSIAAAAGTTSAGRHRSVTAAPDGFEGVR